jgi:hypothetical protein
MKREKTKNKKIIVWIVVSWIIPITVTLIATFGIVYWDLKMGMESEIFTSLCIIYMVWAIIIACRSILYAAKKIVQIKMK